MKELIDNSVKTMMEMVPDADKKHVEKIFTDFFEKGIPFYKTMGFDDNFMEYLYGVGYQSFQSGKFPEALATFEVLYTYNPLEPKYTLGKALCYKEMRKYPNAINDLMRYTLTINDDPIIYWHIYQCFDAMEEPWGAGVALGSVISACDKTQSHDDLRKKAELALVNLSLQLAGSSSTENSITKKR